MFNSTMKPGFSQNPMQGQKGRMPMPQQQQGMQKPSKGGMPMMPQRADSTALQLEQAKQQRSAHGMIPQKNPGQIGMVQRVLGQRSR